jgi:hypothetical protein
MRHTILGIAAVLVIALCSTMVFAEMEQKAPEEPAKAPEATTAPKAEAPAMAPMQKKVGMSAQLSEHQKMARENIVKKDMAAAADEIRKAADVLRAAETKATAKSKKALTASIKELDKLADDVEKGTEASAKKVDEAFARAHAALKAHKTAAAKKKAAPAVK